MKGILIGAAIGYVLGAKAGRERYDQIVRAYHRIIENPTVRKAAGTAKDKVSDTIPGKANGQHRDPVVPTA
jgi:tryptophan synthase beta subunit